MSQTGITDLFSALKKKVEEVVILNDPRVLELMFTCLLCRGHILLNDIPGVGKTLLAHTFARSLNLTFQRIQFTPDLLPSDVTGLNYYNQKENEFVFLPGPVFSQILLADEINRATPRTQSSLLECMQEATVTVDGKTRKLQEPFLVLATQNPLEMEGTFPLPEAQLDRFFMCLQLGYPQLRREKEMIRRFLNHNPLKTVTPVIDSSALIPLQEEISRIYYSEPVMDYTLQLSRKTRELPGIRLGSSPRGSLYLARSAQALAGVRGRDYVIPDDVQDTAIPVLAHRILPDITSSLHEKTGATLIRQILEDVAVPLGSFHQESP